MSKADKGRRGTDTPSMARRGKAGNAKLSPLLDPALAWESFLPLRAAVRSDLAPPADPAWLMARGIEADAPVVFRAVRDHLLPIVRQLERERAIQWYAFPVHDLSSGVPTTAEDKDAYLHFQFRARSPKWEWKPPVPWMMTRRAGIPDAMAGVEKIGIERALRIWGEQSAWYLALVEAHVGVDEVEAMMEVRQFLHFFANMAQMRIA